MELWYQKRWRGKGLLSGLTLSLSFGILPFPSHLSYNLSCQSLNYKNLLNKSVISSGREYISCNKCLPLSFSCIPSSLYVSSIGEGGGRQGSHVMGIHSLVVYGCHDREWDVSQRKNMVGMSTIVEVLISYL